MFQDHSKITSIDSRSPRKPKPDKYKFTPDRS